jgi:hypothetical protein
MGGFSEIGGLHVASAAQSVAGESLDPQMVFKKIDRRERRQRSGGTSMHGSVGSKSSSTLITANLGTSRFADDESFNPESVFERIDRAHRSSSTLDNTSKPARRRSSSSSISDSRARASALKDPPPMAGLICCWLHQVSPCPSRVCRCCGELKAEDCRIVSANKFHEGR